MDVIAQISNPKRHWTRRRILILVTTVLSLAILSLLRLEPEALRDQLLNSQPGLYPVVHVNDGDTIIVQLPSGEETVRLLGVDTPEVKDPRKPVQCFGPEASLHTKQIMAGQSVRLEADPTDSDRDKYGRLLRYVYLPDGTLYNAELIQDGYGFAYTVFPLTKLDQFRQLEHQAQAAYKGLWGACNVNVSSAIKQTAGPR